MSKISCSTSSGCTSSGQSSIGSSSSSSSKIYHYPTQQPVHHHPVHQHQHNHHQYHHQRPKFNSLRDPKQMFLNRQLPPVPTSIKRDAPNKSPGGLISSPSAGVWTVASINNNPNGAYANINSDSNYYSVSNYHQLSKSNDVYDVNSHGAYATSTISTGLENPAFFADSDLTNMMRKAVYLSTLDTGKSFSPHLSHNHQFHHPYEPVVLPSFTKNQIHYQPGLQRLKNEIIASASTLPEFTETTKRPISGFWEMRMQDAAGCSSSVEPKSRWKMSCWAILVLCLVAVAITISAVAYAIANRNLQFGWDNETVKDGDDDGDISPNISSPEERGNRLVIGEFTITNRVFNLALTVWSSREFDALANEVVKSMDEMFLDSPMAKYYNGTEVSEFRQSDPRGVIVQCRISLSGSLSAPAQDVGLTFIQALEQGHGRLPGGTLRVDIRTITFTAVSSVSSEPPPIISSNPGNTQIDFSATTTAKPAPAATPSVDTPSSSSSSSSPEAASSNLQVQVAESAATDPSPADDDQSPPVAWSNWSEWSPCHGVNVRCDPGRIHSRIRKCIGESGQIVEADLCRMKGGEQQELEIRDCRCDESSVGRNSDNPFVSSPKHSNITYRVNVDVDRVDDDEKSHVEEGNRPCNDCQESEICLLQVKAAVPFCAKIKDPRDPRGCGGWCSGHKELCRYVGSNTYQCVDDSECLQGEWQCANGLCIPEERRCDGHFNCFDMSDEMHCQCKEDLEFHCGNKTSCLPISRRCNGIIDCWDGEDEQNCSKTCTDKQFACNSGQCIPVDYFCDSRRHCDDGSDEPDGCNNTTISAPPACFLGQHRCSNGRCISASRLCDGINDCADNSDEIDCDRLEHQSPTANTNIKPRTNIRALLEKVATGQPAINNNRRTTTSAPSASHPQIQSR